MIASGAQANPNPLHWTCAEYPCVITGETVAHQGIGAVHHFVIGKKTITCIAKSDATISNAATNESITVTPTYEKCEANSAPVTVTMNGCDYQLHGGVEDKELHFIESTTDLICPEGKKIEIHLYVNAEEHTTSKSVCTITIEPFTNKLGSTATNVVGSPDHVTLVTTLTPTVEIHGSIVCGASTTQLVGTYTGSTTFKAYKDLGTHLGPPVVYTEGSQIGLTVSE